MARFYRLFGLKDDTYLGGTTYDRLVSLNDDPFLPDPDHFWPTNGGNFDDGETPLDHSDQVRAFRGKVSPVSFKAEPRFTIPFPAYMRICEQTFAFALGVAGAPTSHGGAKLHTVQPLPYGNIVLPHKYLDFVRDDEHVKASGCCVESVELNLPIDDEGTLTTEWWSLFADYVDDDPTPPESVDYEGADQCTPVVALRDCSLFYGDTTESLADVVGLRFGWKNNATADDRHNAGQNVETHIDNDGCIAKLWHPAVTEIRSDPDATYTIDLRNPNVAHDLNTRWKDAEGIVFEIVGGPLANPVDGFEVMRIRIYRGVHTGKTIGDLVKSGRISASYEGAAFYSEPDTADVQVEFVNNVATQLVPTAST